MDPNQTPTNPKLPDQFQTDLDSVTPPNNPSIKSAGAAAPPSHSTNTTIDKGLGHPQGNYGTGARTGTLPATPAPLKARRLRMKAHLRMRTTTNEQSAAASGGEGMEQQAVLNDKERRS